MKTTIDIDYNLLNAISKIMIDKNSTLSLAESCTGGFLSTFFTSKSGASKYFKGSMVTYTNESKIKLLGIQMLPLNQFVLLQMFYDYPIIYPN